ncbi:MAG: glutaredoxin 2 [Halobacteriovoraceae bacterium]|nr:glutaredoxin 2 [Halobacteriovoraceae bacterium]
MHNLYHYLHCPFCIRVRLVLGYLNIPYKSVVLPYDDEKTPLELSGKKMLPIMTFSSGETINESLDIIERLDRDQKLKLKEIIHSPQFENFDSLLNKLGKNIHAMAMPYFIFTPEFTESSRNYFRAKKEAYKGPFSDLVAKRSEFENALQKDLLDLEKNLEPYYFSQTISLYDLLLASHLWGMYVVPEFQFSTKIHDYLMGIKKICHFNYHKDCWEK